MVKTMNIILLVKMYRLLQRLYPVVWINGSMVIRMDDRREPEGVTLLSETPTYIVRFTIYPDLNLVMNGIRILKNNEVALNFRFIYFMTYTVYFPRINTFVT